jgi:hypothetical protein
MPGQLYDLNRNSQPPSFYRGDDVEMDIGLGQNGALLTSLGNVASVTCQLFASQNDTSAPMMACVVLAAAMNLNLTQANWTANAGCHAAFKFPNSATAIPLGGAASVNYWLRITALTNDNPALSLTVLDGPITVRDGPVTSLSAPVAGGFRSFTVNGQAVLQLWDAAAGGYRTLSILNDSGVSTVELSDTVY